MPESLFIDIEFLKILISFCKCSWVSPVNNTFSVNGDFEILKEFLPENNYRTLLNNRTLIDIIFSKDKITFIPENLDMVNKVFLMLNNLKPFNRIKAVLEKEEIKTLIEKLLLMITIYSTIDVCRKPIENNLINNSEDEIFHEANLQAKINARMESMSKSFSLILEENYKTKENEKNLRPDITVEYKNSKLYIELKMGLKKNIIERFKKDVKKIEEYPLAIALCYDPKRYIRKELDFLKIKQEEFILKSKKQMWNKNIYYISEREIIPSSELTSKGKRSKKEDEKFKTNLAFAIYKEKEEI